MNNMTNMTAIKRAVVCAACIALCCVLPVAFHSVGLGSVLSPMHLPVLLCGLVCGGWYGLFCGLAGPLLSSMLTGMPGAMGLMTMVPELMAYGLFSGLAMKLVRTRSLYADMYISLITAMVLGRIVGGIAQVVTIRLMVIDLAYTAYIWIQSYFVVSFPGIVIQLILVPAVTLMLMKAKVIPTRYPKIA